LVFWSKARKEWLEVQGVPKCKASVMCWRPAPTYPWQSEGVKQPHQFRIYKRDRLWVEG
jgi:hypothetical protein